MSINEILKNFSQKENVEVGICSACYFDTIKPILLNTNKEIQGFAEQDIEKRVNPRLTMKEVKSIIAIGIGYGKHFDIKLDNSLRGVISQGAVGMDYHIIVKEKLEKLAGIIKSNSECSHLNYKIYSDTGPLVDRAVALRCKLGVLGKHHSVISKKFGSKMFIGYMLTDLPFNFKEHDVGLCSQCNICIKSCPTGALDENGFQMEKCISYLTQKKGLLTPFQMKAIGRSLYGCDICQNACPMNKNKEAEIINDIDQVMPKIESILNMSNKEFKIKYSSTAMGWRGKKVIQRNAICALSNIGGEECVRLITPFLQSEDDVLKKQAEQALNIIKENL